MRRGLAAAYCLLQCCLIASDASVQNAYNLMNVFGGIMQSAIIQAALSEWRKLPPDELSCVDEKLQQRGISVRSLMQQGIMPFDARLADIRSSCRFAQEPEVVDLPPVGNQSGESSTYVVGGLALGAQVAFNSAAYREYQCTPSEQFSGLTWCHKETNEPGPRGPRRSSYTILHAQGGAAFYINRELDHASFGLGEAEAEIDRLSRRFGGPPRQIRIPHGADPIFSNGVIASWGTVALEPLLDKASQDLMAAGKSPRKGILVDFLSDFQRSVRVGLPVFRVAGGAGFVWAASFDQNGRGQLRFFAIDAF
jgi:hypothetical protein